jgi:hypothetical protein
MNDRTKAALIGGAAAGLLSIIPILGTCCFLWAIGGGALAVYMYLNKSTMPFEAADGAKLGAMAGAIGAGIYLVIALPMMLLGGAVQISQQLQQAGGGGLAAFGAGLGIFMVFIVAGIIVGFGAIGGLIGAAVFGKNRPGGGSTMPPPPPPTNYGGTQPPAGTGYSDGSGGTYGSGS